MSREVVDDPAPGPRALEPELVALAGVRAHLHVRQRTFFVQIDRIDPMPGWQPGNPCALYVAALRTTR